MYCEFEWLGSLPWFKTYDGCQQEICTPPAQPGTYIGQHETKECEGPG